MSANVLSLVPEMSASHVPENDWPTVERADQVPCQLAWAFFADHVPERVTSPESLTSVQVPCAAFGVRAEISADHDPRNTWAVPAVAVHVPRNTRGVS